MKELRAEELRIGNLININGLIVNIDARTIFDFDHDNRKKEPIPLTEEWLIKFGLLKTKEGSFLLGCYDLIGYEDSYRILLPKNGILATIKYVHQLQNLYFALTQTELIIKP